ncbi:MAG TPA: lipid droplet-associated protein [Mycobacteriales bacterium]|nr:lipid droplet-associated protein [Mycobacteriales bacterium]
MSTPIPMPLRAVAGLAAVAIDSARKLPKQVVGLPVLAVSTALQLSLKAQQRYAELVARGDQLLGQLRPPGEGPPPWARFDDEPADFGGGPNGVRPVSAFDAAADRADQLLDEDAVGVLGTGEEVLDTLADAELADRERVEEELVDRAESPGEAGAGGGRPRQSDAGPPDDAVERLEAIEALEVAEAAAAAEAAEAAEAADVTEVAEVAEAAIETAVAVEAAAEAGAVEPDVDATDPDAYDGYLAAAAPLAGYDELSIPQLRGRLRKLSEEQLEQLVAYERRNAARAPYLTMLENRLTAVRSR